MTAGIIKQPSKIKIWLLQARTPFVTASIIPVLVGTSVGFAVTGSLNVVLFVLALAAIICLHLGANLTNEYFDHLSGNDRLNDNRNPFSGGSGLMLEGLTTPPAVLFAARVVFAAGAISGIAILLITKSAFILTIGLIGLFGGYFYTANPFRFGYRGAGEIVIAFLFGLLPVYGACFLQTGAVSTVALAPALIVSMLIFLIILINEFPDRRADAAVSKRTLVVLLGPGQAAKIYRAALAVSYIIAVTAAIVQPQIRLACLLYLLTTPLAAATLIYLKTDSLAGPDRYRANKFTVLLHLSAGLLMSVGFIITRNLN